MEVSTFERGEGSILVMDIAPLHCVKINHRQCLFVVIALYMCVMTTDLAFVADLYCIKELRHSITYTYPSSKVSRNWLEYKNNIHSSSVIRCNETLWQDYGKVTKDDGPR